MNNKLNLPFAIGYTSYLYQDFRQRPRNGEIGFAQPCPNDRLLPFQLRRPNSLATTFTVYLYEANSNTFIEDLSAYIVPADKEIVSRGSFDYVTYFGQNAFSASHTMDCGVYYIKWTDGTYTYYSEIFEVMSSITEVAAGIISSGEELIMADATEHIISWM